jgi:hypothetical protein
MTSNTSFGHKKIETKIKSEKFRGGEILVYPVSHRRNKIRIIPQNAVKFYLMNQAGNYKIYVDFLEHSNMERQALGS